MRHDEKDETQISAKGVLRPEEGQQAFQLRLFQPHPALREWVEYYWAVDWDLGTRTFVQAVVTNPTIDLSFEDDPAANPSGLCLVATGIAPRSYKRTLRGRGRVFAVHFHPGMFHPWWVGSVASLTAKAERLAAGSRSWTADAVALLPSLFDAPDPERVAAVDALLLEHRPPDDAVGAALRDLVHAARRDRELWVTPALARRRGVSLRTNQRQFLEYVGVGPKWVGQRYRVQAAIDALDQERTRQGERLDLTRLALDLGYYDLAHFSRDFRTVTGYSPDGYRRPGS